MRWLRVVAPPHLEPATAEELQPLRLPICRSFNPLRQQWPLSRLSTSRPANGGRLRAADTTQDDSADQHSLSGRSQRWRRPPAAAACALEQLQRAVRLFCSGGGHFLSMAGSLCMCRVAGVGSHAAGLLTMTFVEA